MKRALEEEHLLQFIGMQKLVINIRKHFHKNKESSYLNYRYVNNFYGWTISQKLPLNNFEWIEKTSQFNEDFIKNYNWESDKGYFLEVDVQCLKKKMNLTMI